jgi:hypothetical protein
MAEIRSLALLVPYADLGGVRIICVRREPVLDGLPVKGLVAVPVVLGRGYDRDDGKARRLEDHDRPLQRGPRLMAILEVLREWKTPPVRLADSDVAAGTDGRPQRIHGLGQVAEHEAGPKAECRVVGLGLERPARPVTELERHQLGDSRLLCPRDRDSMELGRDLDPLHIAAERFRQQDRRSPAAGSDVEHPRAGPQPEPLAEEQQLLPRRRILDLVRRLGDRVVARDHAVII